MLGEWRICVLSSGGAFVFLHTCRELLTSLAHVSIGTVSVLAEGLSHLLAFSEVTWSVYEL